MTTTAKKNKKKDGESGQVFLEFVFLLLVMFIISFALVKVTSSSVGDRWTAIISIITGHNSSSPTPLELQ